ncbi:MAG: hypothetical protein QME49_07450 [bacterium]|nr:hypothetical protein [bacterium]
MFKNLLFLLILFVMAKPTGADMGLKHYEISLIYSKNTIQCERVTLKYTYAERAKNIQSFPGQNTYKVNVVSSVGRVLKTLYLIVDKKASPITQKHSLLEEVSPKQKSYKLIQRSNLYKGNSLYKVKKSVEKQAIEDEKMKILDKQSIILNVPYFENASKIDIYNTVGQKVQTIRLDNR